MGDNAHAFPQAFMPLLRQKPPSASAGTVHEAAAVAYQQQRQQQQQQQNLLSSLSFGLAVNHVQQASAAAGSLTSPSAAQHGPDAPGASSSGGMGWGLVSAHASRAAAPAKPNSHDRTASLYQCADCLKRYARPEHLQRHIATHTLGKRFACDVCGKAFGRADLLKRHRANHEEDPAGMKKRRLASAPGAARVAQACSGCARARVKCEEVKPCARCRTRGIQCMYSSASAAAASPHHSMLRRTVSPDDSGQTAPQQAGASHSPSQSPPGYVQEQQQQQQSQLYQMATSVPHHPMGAVGAVAGGYPVLPGGSPSFDPSANHASLAMHSEGAPVAITTGTLTPDVKMPFSDFMRGVLYQHNMDTSGAVPSQGLAVLDFCNNSNLDLDDMDFGLLGNWSNTGQVASQHQQQQQHHQMEPHHQQQQHDEDAWTSDEDSPDISNLRQRLVRLWDDKRLRWDPKPQDTGYREQENLLAPSGGATIAETARLAYDTVATASPSSASDRRLDGLSRDRILAIMLATCRGNTAMARVAAAFPATDLLDSLIHIFLAAHIAEASSYIHIPSFSVDNSPPELLACCASAGATMTSNSTLRRLGFAIQEAVRMTIPNSFEDNNQRISDRGLVQALVLGQDIGLWSGNKRKMEIAECHTNIPITMMKYRSRFQMASYPAILVTADDSGAELESKWAQWREQESWKRLVFHCFLRDAQVSFTSLRAPHISYAELTLPLPAPSQLWTARNASEWQTCYLAIDRGSADERESCLGDLIRNPDLLARNRHGLDVQLAISIYLHGFWSLVWEFRQMAAAHRHSIFSSPAAAGSTSTSSGTSNDGSPDSSGSSSSKPASSAVLLLNSRHQDLCGTLDSFAVETTGWPELTEGGSLMVHLLQLHLHVSLDDLQVFAGRRGDDAARRAHPALRRWAASAQSRRALWHAGQILRLARTFPRGRLKDASAIAVHHAALALWTYGVVTRAAAAATPSPSTNGSSSTSDRDCDDLVFLDGPHSSQVAAFVALGQGRAAIRAPPRPRPSGGNDKSTGWDGAYDDSGGGDDGGGGGGGGVAPLSESRACMQVAQDVLRANFAGEDGRADGNLLPIVDNICCLLAMLGSAADEITKR